MYINNETIKKFRNHQKKLIFRGGSSKLSFASFVQVGSSIMGGSSNVSGALQKTALAHSVK
jgi:hypothetical protein